MTVYRLEGIAGRDSPGAHRIVASSPVKRKYAGNENPMESAGDYLRLVSFFSARDSGGTLPDTRQPVSRSQVCDHHPTGQYPNEGVARRPTKYYAMSGAFPSLKARDMFAILGRQPLSYRIVRQSGSHRRLESPAYPPLTLSFHDADTLPAGVVRKILCKDVGLTEEQALKLI